MLPISAAVPFSSAKYVTALVFNKRQKKRIRNGEKCRSNKISTQFHPFVYETVYCFFWWHSTTRSPTPWLPNPKPPLLFVRHSFRIHFDIFPLLWNCHCRYLFVRPLSFGETTTTAGHLEEISVCCIFFLSFFFNIVAFRCPFIDLNVGCLAFLCVSPEKF